MQRSMRTTTPLREETTILTILAILIFLIIIISRRRRRGNMRSSGSGNCISLPAPDRLGCDWRMHTPSEPLCKEAPLPPPLRGRGGGGGCALKESPFDLHFRAPFSGDPS
jgi:hypothetical protein